MASKELVFEKNSSSDKIKESLQENQDATELIFKNCQALSLDNVESFLEDINSDLDALTIHNCQLFDDECAAKISEHCTKLSRISFTGCCKVLTSVGISSFIKNCPNLKCVTIMSTESDDDNDSNNNDDERSWTLGDDLFASFLQRTDLILEQFALSGFENVTTNALKHFLEHVGSNIKVLDLSELQAITDEVIEKVVDTCPSLEDVCLSHCKLTDQGINRFCAKCRALQSVNFSGCQNITDDSVIALSTNCSSLRKVQLSWCVKLTEKSLDALVTNCQDLTFVDMSQCTIRHLPFEILEHFSLQEIKVEGCKGLRCPPLDIANKGLESCRQFLKKCNLQSLCRMTFLGNQGSGKTSLMLSLPTMSQSVADTSTEGVHVGTWRPFKSGKESIDLGTDIQKKMLSLTVDMWDCGGRTCLQGVHPLFLCEQALYAIVFDIHDPFKLESVVSWMLLMRSKAPTSPFIVVGTHADDADDRQELSKQVIQAVKKADSQCRQEYQAEIDTLRDLGQEKCVESRVNRLQNLVENWSKLPEHVYFVSTLKGKGMLELQHAISETLLDGQLFPHLAEEISNSIVYLYSSILQLRENNSVLLSWDHYLQVASDAGVTDADIEQTTAVLEYKGCILVLNIPSSQHTQGPSKIVCVNPSALLNCMAGVLCETDPREYVPQFVKAGKVEKFWPTGARPNEWTLRAAIDDIVTKGLVRESVVPLCFQIPSLLDEEELQNIISLLRSLGFLVEGAPKGNYDVELVMSQYKSCSVFKRYYVPLMTKLPEELKDTTVWPSSPPDGTIQVGWRYKFRDLVTVDCTKMLIGACANLKPSCEVCAYWNSGVILKVGPVTVRMSRDNSTLDVIGRCKVTNGSKQALNMMWFVLAKFFYGIETLLMNFKGVCPMVLVPIIGCNRPKHKPLYELVSDYNSQLSHHTNYRWFIPPAALDAEEHAEIPSDTVSWLDRKSVV